jgi:hypothetical protein
MASGQMLTVEYMMFFAIGIALVIITFFIFSNANDSYKKATLTQQFDKLAEGIRIISIQVYETAKWTNSTITYYYQIPTRLSGSYYEISGEGSPYFNIESTDKFIVRGYKYIIPFNGHVLSTAEVLKITSSGNDVTIW